MSFLLKYKDLNEKREIPNENYTLSAFKLTLTHPFTNKTLIFFYLTIVQFNRGLASEHRNQDFKLASLR